jgi:hypothetical protein
MVIAVEEVAAPESSCLASQLEVIQSLEKSDQLSSLFSLCSHQALGALIKRA